MTVTTCPPDVWTTIPAVVGGDMLLTSSNGLYVHTGAGPGPTDVGAAYALPALEGMVIAAGLAVRVRPGSPKGCRVTSVAV